MLVRPEPSQEAAPIWFVTKETWPKIRASLPGLAQAFASACGFEPTPGRAQILPGPEGEIAGVLFGIEGTEFTGARFVASGANGNIAASRPLPLRRPPA